MRNLALLAVMAVAIVVGARLILAQKLAPVMTDVEARIVGPDCKPLGNTAMEFSDTDRNRFPDDAPSHAEATTDEHGVAHFRWKAGVSQMWVRVKGVGYGMCGLTEFVPGAITKATFPPLAPYSSITGVIPKELIGKAAVVRAYNGGFEGGREISIDQTGRFEFADLDADHWYLYAVDVKGHRLVDASFNLNPGVHIHAVNFRPDAEEEAPASTQPAAAGRPDSHQDENITWASGTIRDVKGNPLSGVNVYVLATYYGGLRMSEDAKKTTTDRNGRYAIRGASYLNMFSGAIVAHKEGFAPAMAWIDQFGLFHFGEGAPASQRSRERDLTLTDVGGTLDVRVLGEGRPVAGISVAIRGTGKELRHALAGITTEVRPEIEGFLYPEFTTDSHGEVRYKLLMPDCYRVIAVGRAEGNEESGETRIFDELSVPWGRRRPYAIAEGVAVRSGETQSVLMRISQQDGTAAFTIHDTDGQSHAGEFPFRWCPARQSDGSATTIKLDDAGGASHPFGSPGLWHIDVQHRQSPIRSIPLQGPPYDSAEGIVAVSAAMKGTMSPVFTARHHSLGTAEIHVFDVNGRPLKAVVEIRQGNSTPAVVGTTDSEGFARLEGVREWPYLRLNVFPVGVDGGEVPSTTSEDAALRGRIFIPDQPGVIKGDEVTQCVLRQIPAGYVRGKVHPASGTNLDQYAVSVDGDIWKVKYDVKTGGYLAGPLVAGKTRIGVNFSYGEAGAQDVMVSGGDVVHVDLTATVTEFQKRNADLISLTDGVRGLSREQGLLQGKVLLSDGKTAYRAVVNYVLPHQYEAFYWGMTDIQGMIDWRETEHWQEEHGEEPRGGPIEPVVVALLPGACGAVIAPLPKKGESLSLVLPPSLILRGRVTVAGADAGGQIGTIRVYAAYEGKGTLNGMLSLNATAQADGTYELAGLTPGTYRVQASLDDIWLSASRTLQVKDQSPGAINLDIGKPGAPVSVKVTDERGTALPGKLVVVDRPAGPLTDALWPESFESDGAGMAWIPTLEAGKHTVAVGNAKKEIEVPALPASGAVEVTIVVGGSETGR